MSKSLRTIQKLAKAGKIISNIFMIVCIVALCLCVASFASVIANVEDVLAQIGGVTIHGLIPNMAASDRTVVLITIATACVPIIGYIIVSALAARYFKHELADGTPFTFRGAEEMRKLGIRAIVIPLICAILAVIVNAVLSSIYVSATEYSFRVTFSLTAGIVFLILSVIFKHGAEIAEASKAAGE